MFEQEGKLASMMKYAGYLKGLHFPMSKQDIIEYAKEKDAPDKLLTILEKIPDKDYQKLVDVENEVSKLI